MGSNMRCVRYKVMEGRIICVIGPYITGAQAFALVKFTGRMGVFVFLCGFALWWGKLMSPVITADVLAWLPLKRAWQDWLFFHTGIIALWSFGFMLFMSVFTHVIDKIAPPLFGQRRKVIFTPDEVQVKIAFFLPRLSGKRADVTFEMVQHPGNDDMQDKEDRQEAVFLKRTGVVLMRCGLRSPVQIAQIYDRTPFDLGHSAQDVVLVLQHLLNSPVPSADGVAGAQPEFRKKRAL